MLVTEHGRQRAISKAEVCVSQIMNRAAKGDLQAAKVALGLIRESEAVMEAEQPEHISEHSKAMTEMLAQRLRLMQAATSPEEA